jgi:DNA polymerase III subunit delta
VTPEQALAQATKGELLPVYVVAGDEQLLRDKVVAALRASALGGGVPAFNEDKFTAGEASVDKVIAAAQTVPMMAPKRFVLVRAVERWDSAPAEDDDSRRASPLDQLAEYVGKAVPSTCMVLVAAKLDGRRKLAAVAKKSGIIVTCDPLDDRALVEWILAQARDRGSPMDRDVAELLAQIAGPELTYVNDALERLALYAGEGNAITEEAVALCVARVRTADTWALVDAVGARDLGAAMRMLVDVYDPRDRGLPLLGALAWSLRQLLKFQCAVAEGAGVEDAARRAGVYQPFRARELAGKARAFRGRDLERCMLVLADTDVALKSSRRPADAILEDMLTRLCKRAA